MISLIDTNIFAGAFYLETKSSTKLFNGMSNLHQKVGICAFQLYEIQILFDKIHHKRFPGSDNFKHSYFMVEHALNRFYDWYSSPKAIVLPSDYIFNESQLTLDDQRKYNLLKFGGVNTNGDKVKGDINDLFFFRNAFQYNASYIITNDNQVLLSCDSTPNTSKFSISLRGNSSTFHNSKIMTQNPFICSEVYNRRWVNGECIS